jgi:hypothetical protein
MKKILIIIAILLSLASAQAQVPNWNEWFRQKKTQRNYLTQQIAALKVYLEYLKQGYDIAENGLTVIGDIKDGTFNLHKDYFNSLKQVSPIVGNAPKLNDILTYQRVIIHDMRKLCDDTRADQNFTSAEVSYIGAIYQDMLTGCNDALDRLTVITTAGEAEMEDDERLHRLDRIHDEMLDRVAFTNDFIATTRQLSLQRTREREDLNTTKFLYGELSPF